MIREGSAEHHSISPIATKRTSPPMPIWAPRPERGGTSGAPNNGRKGITASAGMVAAGASEAGAMEVAVAGEAAVAGLVEVVATPTTSLFKGVNVRSSRGVRVLPA